MVEKNSQSYQYIIRIWLAPILLLAWLGGCADALDQTENAELNSPVGGLLHIGDQMQAEGDVQGALEFYARAVQRAPKDAAAHRKLAGVLESRGDDADAAEQDRLLVGLEPGKIDDHCAYGRVLIKLNKASEAKEQYEAALKIDGTSIRALNGLGISLDLLSDHTGAREDYEAALAEKPDDLVTLNNLGHSYILTGEYEQAIKLLEPAGVNPAAPAALRQNLADAYGLSGMDADAERVLTMDMQPPQVKTVLTRYHALRSKESKLSLYAHLGSFGTPDLAGARTEKLKVQFAGALGALTVEVVPEVDEEGHTPVFSIRAHDFAGPMAAQSFCEKLKKGGAFCRVHEE